MRGEKTVELGFDFEYSKGGDFEKASAITLKAPGRHQFSTHARMSSYVSGALLAALPKLDSLIKMAEKSERSSKPTAEPTESDDSTDILTLVSAGMPPRDYEEMLNYIMSAITNNNQLAFVAGTDIPLNDEVLDAIEEKGGIDAVMTLVSEFTGFFGDQVFGTSARTTGT